ncbi:MAG: terminase large subunit domain-containing protein [Pyrinomonadaceae bacterium]
MPFLPKQVDWKRMPVEIRESFLAALRLRATAIAEEHLSPVELAQACGIVPDDWQRDLLNSTERQVILNCSRQSGKTTIAALIALHRALYVPNSLVLVLSPSQRQSQESYRKIRDNYNSLIGVPEVTQESSLKLELANNSRVQVLPGKEATVRGFSGVSLLVVDEAARVEDGLYQSIRPMLAVSQGRIILLSTPFGSRGFFWQEWVEGGGDWKRVRITADMCPRIAPEWLAKERERIGDWWFSQEYNCTFVDSLEACFSSADIEAAFTNEVQPLWAL